MSKASVMKELYTLVLCLKLVNLLNREVKVTLVFIPDLVMR